ncbi:TPA: restriction endonuclease subunit S [Mannheimia haemolytica]|uniref:restriction endonuclease subunit S n=1 Tax=Mannheimia haemolytica TaxID=75985 RepID=UPI0035AF50DC
MSKVSCKLEDLIIYISRGITPKYTEKSDNSCIVLNQKCIRDFSINFNPSRKNDISLKKISDEKFIEQYDVLINSTGVGTLGRVAQFLGNAPNSITVDSHITIVRPDANKIHPLFFGYLLKSKQSEIESFAQGTTGQTELSRDDLKNMVVEFTNNKELQIKHSEFLLNIDQKIHLNTQTNQTLEAIAQVIFKSWFVDFDPVRAKAAVLSEGKSEHEANLAAMLVICGKDTSELNDTEYKALWQIAEAFPSELVENEQFGEVPKGWEVKPLPEIIDFLEGPGIRNWQYTEKEDGVKFINIRCIKNNDLSLETANKITQEEAFGKYTHFQLKEDDIVISTSGTLGRFAFVRKNHLPLCLNTSVIRFRPIENISTLAFITGFVETQLQYELEIRASGSAQKNFGPMHLKQIVMLVPDFNLLSLHQKFIHSFFEKRKTNLDEIDNLAKTRDLLLPKLLNGEI